MTDHAMPVSVAVDGDVFAAHPDYIALIMLAQGIGNGPSDDASSAVLDAAEQHLLTRRLTRPADHPHIAAWRAAFSAFGAKPSKYPCSAEALTARVLKGATLPRVNVLVDLYNAVSVRTLTPIGGEDLDHLQGPLRLTIATGDEPFDGHDGAPRPGEIIWRDDAGVTCRRWNWRQGQRTRLTDATTRAFFIFDRLPGLDENQLNDAASQLESLLNARWPTCTTQRIRLNRDQPRSSTISQTDRTAAPNCCN
jgi:DNA/RNA-binding domain of Phe-tRNA-synthetase-like protein